jgi:hypothetical protein
MPRLPQATNLCPRITFSASALGFTEVSFALATDAMSRRSASGASSRVTGTTGHLGADLVGEASLDALDCSLEEGEDREGPERRALLRDGDHAQGHQEQQAHAALERRPTEVRNGGRASPSLARALDA